jgi:hypothetical protein
MVLYYYLVYALIYNLYFYVQRSLSTNMVAEGKSEVH